jgi:hypothetical protein
MGNLVGGVAAGASAGAAAGPWGAVIGGVVGAIKGLISGGNAATLTGAAFCSFTPDGHLDVAQIGDGRSITMPSHWDYSMALISQMSRGLYEMYLVGAYAFHSKPVAMPADEAKAYYPNIIPPEVANRYLPAAQAWNIPPTAAAAAAGGGVGGLLAAAGAGLAALLLL